MGLRSAIRGGLPIGKLRAATRAPGSQGYNAYAYAGNNPATLLDPSGHSVLGDLATTAGQGIAQLVGAIDGMVQMLTDLGSWELPPWAKAVILALVVFGLTMVRSMIVMESIGGMVAGALLLVLARHLGRLRSLST